MDVEQLADCDVFNISSAAALAGYKHPQRFRDVALSDPVFHRHEVRDPEGRLVTIATHSNSAAAYGEQLRAAKTQVRRANLRQSPVVHRLVGDDES